MEEQSLSYKILELFTGLDGPTAYSAIFGMLLICGLGVPLPEDITLIAAGILASTKSISIIGAYISGYFGVLSGDAFLFFIGRRYGRKVFTLPLFNKIFTPDRILRAEERIQANAKKICFTARFLPGLRAPIYLTAGILGVKPKIFLFQDGLAALISVPIWVYVGIWFGNNIHAALNMAVKLQALIMIVVALLIGYFILRHFRRKKLRQGSL